MDQHGQGNALINSLFMCFPEKMSKCFRAIITKYTENTQIKTHHIPFINILGTHDGISQKELTAMLPFDKSRVSTVVHELTNMGLVVNDSDGKVSSLRLTDSGRNMFAMCQMLKDLMVNLVLVDFSEEELENLVNLMMKLDRRMDMVLNNLGS